VAFIISCSPASETEFVLASVTQSAARIDAGLAAVTVEPASRDRAVYPLPSGNTLSVFARYQLFAVPPATRFSAPIS
jgi:hypothetical protein